MSLKIPRYPPSTTSGSRGSNDVFILDSTLSLILSHSFSSSCSSSLPLFAFASFSIKPSTNHVTPLTTDQSWCHLHGKKIPQSRDFSSTNQAKVLDFCFTKLSWIPCLSYTSHVAKGTEHANSSCQGHLSTLGLGKYPSQLDQKDG